MNKTHLTKFSTFKLRISGNYCTIIKVIYEIPTVIISGKGLKASLSSIRNRQGCPLLFNMVLEVLPRAAGQEKGTEGIQIGKKKVKLPLFRDDSSLCRKS